MNARLTIAVLGLTLIGSPAWAAGDHAGHGGGAQKQNQPAAASDAVMAEGEVRKVDKDAGKLTLKHGELKTLQMPAMTMVFRVTDPAMLDQVKVGDKVNFMAEKVGGQFTVTRIEPKG